MLVRVVVKHNGEQILSMDGEIAKEGDIGRLVSEAYAWLRANRKDLSMFDVTLSLDKVH